MQVEVGLADALAELAGYVAQDDRAGVVADLQQRWAKARVRILLVGEAKRGKSTVGNAILGREVLPMGVIPLTAVPTTVRQGEPERVEVRGADGAVRTTSLADLARFVTERGNPRNERGVVEVIVYVSGGLPHPSAELVDTPGVGSVHEHNTAAAQAAMGRMDIAVFVLSADPPVSAAEQALLSQVREYATRTFVVLNKIDQLDAADRADAELFTRQMVAGPLRLAPSDVTVFSVSARQAVRATDRSDAQWLTSGMPEFLQRVQQQLAASWRSDLATSISSAARRVVAELVDEAALAQRARQLWTQDRNDQIAAFEQYLQGLSTRRDDAVAVASGQVNRWQQALNEDAAGMLAPMARAIHRELEAGLAAGPAMSSAEREMAGWRIITDSLVVQIREWQQKWGDRLVAATMEAAVSQQHLLDETFAGIRAAAAAMLHLDLTASPARLSLPERTGFRFDVTPTSGWDEPVTSAIRRRIPGAAGRTRMNRYLKAEADRLVDKHIGRVRSDFQARMAQFSRELRAEAAQLYTVRQAQLLRTLELARTASPPDPGLDRPVAPADRGASAAADDSRLRALAHRFQLQWPS